MSQSPQRQSDFLGRGTDKAKVLLEDKENDGTQNSGKNGWMSAKSFYGPSPSRTSLGQRSPLYNSTYSNSSSRIPNVSQSQEEALKKYKNRIER